ncbi:hypothetical protein F5B21DRAFT_510079 [Xylaria acuta]|nr:hypothetical protein F5B21DRAFT_510079 [Xylaria acuta]
METPMGPPQQNFGHSEVTDGGSFSFQDNVAGNLNITYSGNSPQEPLDNLTEAAFNSATRQHSPFCLNGTRQDLLEFLELIQKWAYGEGVERIDWLRGMAGGGDLGSARKFATTVAAQFDKQSSEFKNYIKDVVASDPDIRGRGLHEQWTKLVSELLARLGKSMFPHTMVIVVDALDKCNDEDDLC